ncbi:sugar kinase [Halobacteriales archaeon Cl-PHB]
MTAFVTFGETALRFSPSGYERLQTAAETSVHVDGEESNAAVAATCLGADSTWISRLPANPLGKRVVATLEGHGVDTHVAWDDEGRQGLVFAEAAAPPRNASRVQDRHDTAASRATASDLPMATVQDADVVFTGASTPALSADAANTTEAMLRAGSGAGALTALDLDFDPALHEPAHVKAVVEHLFDHVDVLVANEDHARTVLPRSGKPRELANGLVAEYGLEMVVVTRSEHGAVLMHDTPGTNVIHERETVDAEPVDQTGQHEAFVGGFLQRLGDGADAAEALTYGVATSALARTTPGPLLTVDREEVDAVADQVQETAR